MTGLLVSVRDAIEAEEAVRGGANLIDVKEPHGGSLGAASTDTIRQVLRAVAGRAPVSVALGELFQDDPPPRVPAGVSFAKLGLSAARSNADWSERWAQRLAELPEQTLPVAVLYADWEVAGSPGPDELLREAARVGCRALLVDTFDKRGGNLFQYMTVTQLRPYLDEARQRQWMIVLAGSLDHASLADAMALQPDLIAVRGAVAHPNRDGRVRAELVADLARAISRLHNSRRFA